MLFSYEKSSNISPVSFPIFYWLNMQAHLVLKLIDTHIKVPYFPITRYEILVYLVYLVKKKKKKATTSI